MTVPYIKLNDSNMIPAVGLGEYSVKAEGPIMSWCRAGTWQPTAKAEEVTFSIAYALEEAGYRHLDCAWYNMVCLFVYHFSQLHALPGSIKTRKTLGLVYVHRAFLGPKYSYAISTYFRS